MAIEAIAAMGSQAASSKTADAATQLASSTSAQAAPTNPSTNISTPAPSGPTLSLRAEGVSGKFTGNMAADLSSHVYRSIESKVGVELPSIGSSNNNMIDDAKKALLPENSAIAPDGVTKVETGNDTLKALSKTFDHAVFMAMVNQVVSGVSDTSRTLIKQQ